ncbi:organic solvent tolerance protein OstA [Flavobacterium alvei]|uniref:Organic solvent tolerance protein OstA n=1 Tax=Flavobacterium alvei TaxID=2080416 RepID=A0A2S5AE50_9FLAO|nr:putative LPS assembly protein LptD [Flavobacterium alvei]POY40828.1 organic solvent tolerance protein OstA [Flavobacterium alvei]
MTHQKTSHIFTKIALIPLNTNLFNIVLLSFFLTLGTCNIYSQDRYNKTSSIPVQNQKDKSISTPKKDAKSTTITKTISDTITKDSIQPKVLLEDKVRYNASNYVKIEQKKKLITLYDNAELYYQDTELKAGIIVLNYEKNEVYAGRIKDSTGKYTQFPNFKQAENVIEPDSIRFNFKTKKALIWNSKTDQGEFKVKAVITKKENDSVYFLKKARFTTSTNVENPEYYFQTNKVKIIPGKKVVTGLTNLVIANVPTPIALPFAFFPMTKETSVSGILLPSYNDSNNRGFSLQNGGYYFALSDNYDLTVLGDYYTNGSYALRFESSYAKRYSFRGNLNFRFENLINSERGYPDYSKQSIYNLQWSHSKDSKGSPNSTFSASVNMGSSKYFQQSINQSNVGSNLNNTLSSSVSYSKTFPGTVGSRLALTATHSQNTQTSEINMTLPDLQYSVDRIYPFVGKDGVKKGFFKNINLLYNLSGKNSFVTTDSLFFTKEMFDNAKLGVQHSIPLSTNFKLFKHFSASTSMNYNEVWTIKTIRRNYDKEQSAVVDQTVNGFDSFRTYNFTSSLGTTIYGTFNFKPDSKIKSIRHVMRPSISYGYTPSFEKYFDTYATDATGKMTKDYTRFEGGVFGAPGNSNSNIVGFDLSNTFEAKITDPDSTKVEPKKIMLLNNLNFATSYNFNADGKTTFAWAPIRVSGGTQLFKDKLNMNFGATLDPYAIDNAGNTINVYNINNGGSLFRMTSANMTLNYSISSRDSDKDEKDKDKNKQGQRNGGRDDDLFGRSTMDHARGSSQFDDEEDTGTDKITEFFASKLPWDMTFAYSLTYGNNNRQNKITGNSIMISANGDLTPKWKVGVSTGYDFVLNGVTYTQLRFERDLLSWRMDFNWQPFGDQANWSFFIGIKSGILSDIKYDKRSASNR